jgi:hypothetical protein
LSQNETKQQPPWSTALHTSPPLGHSHHSQAFVTLALTFHSFSLPSPYIPCWPVDALQHCRTGSPQGLCTAGQAHPRAFALQDRPTPGPLHCRTGPPQGLCTAGQAHPRALFNCHLSRQAPVIILAQIASLPPVSLLCLLFPDSADYRL